jgi:5-methylcytosine-specific restriction endonuclease McrA
MLARLEKGPLSTFEADHSPHRGQTLICELRAEGYVINVVQIDGIGHYQLMGKETRVKIKREMQNAYYESEHWRGVARRRRELDGHCCVQCKTGGLLEVHHVRYRLFDENLHQDLHSLCPACHASLHDEISGSQVHFPRFVSEPIAQRIEAIA